MQPLLQSLEPDIDFAFVEFGLSEEQFLRQTPREWQRRVHAWRQKQDREDRRTARVCMVLAWCHGDHDAIEDNFMPKPVREEEQSPEEMLAVLGAAGATIS